MSRRLLPYLALFNVTNTSFSWHPIREIAALASHFSGISDLYIGIEPFCAETRPPQDSRTVENIRADMSWVADIPNLLSPSSLKINGPPTTHLHIMQLLRMSNDKHALRIVHLSALDPDILTELELLLGRSSHSIEDLALTFCPDLYLLVRYHPKLSGFASDYIECDPMVWTIDASTLTNLHTIRLEHCLHTLDGRLEAFSLHRWTQLLNFVGHFSAALVQCIIFDIKITPWDPPDSNIVRALESMDWPRLGVILRGFKNLVNVHVKLHCWSGEPHEEERKVAIKYLELMAKGLATLKVEGKAVFDWMYNIEDKGGLQPGVFRLP
ncbi:hypothetical protein EIP86_011170 [Pleurotus ostreatoroseus]|nr:hypothetical protein EIP86_011170 [Pleurotus ostreatoroseus]